MFPLRHAGRLGPRVSSSAALVAALVLLSAHAAPAQTGEAALLGDPRLEKKVTLKLRKAPLSDVTAELGRLAGVTLHTTPDTADEPAVVHVTDQPAREVMRQLSRLFDFRWARSGQAGEYRYELYQDLNGKRTEEALRQQDRARALQALQAALLKQVEQYRERPNPQREATLRVALALTPGHWEALAAGRTLRFSTRQEPGAFLLPPPLATEMLRTSQRDGGSVVEAVQLRFWTSFSLSEARLHYRATTVSAGGAGGGGGLVANAFSVAPGAGQPPDEDQVAAWQRDPMLGARSMLRIDPMKAAHGRRLGPGQTFLHVYELLPELAEAYGVDLVADAYRTQRFSRQPPPMPQETALYEALNSHLQFAADWSRDGDFLRSRSSTWYHDRLAEIPARVVRHWSALLRREGRMTLENAVAVVSSLRDEQLPHFGSFLQDTGVYLHTSGPGARGGFEQEGRREVLRAYAALQPRQQEALRSGGQIAFAQMPPPARQWLLAAAEQQRRELRTFGLPPGELPPGLLSLSAVTVQREVTSVGDDQVRSILRALDGPKAGEQVGSMSQGGSLPPGLAVGGQVFQQLTWRYQYAEAAAWTLDLSLPWVYVDPSVKQPEAPEAPENAGPAAAQAPLER